eukprot:TRINITY_DN7081_c0_g1_i2.p1 TRINITY_DN7081_c0_g1~~TRINITY_DN7081_c0_g1_i2.p1  ORF type:complete len:153 (-),score=16.88 TRINITY_DN7081_c0_g1_i2:55-513(-)
MENAIACTTNHLTTFAITIIITITKNETVNCSNPVSSNASSCNIIDDIFIYQSENTNAIKLLQRVDEYLEDLALRFNVTTGIILEILLPQKVLIIIGLRQDISVSAGVGENVVITNPNSYTADTVLAVLSASFNDTKEFTNDTVRLEKSCCC